MLYFIKRSEHIIYYINTQTLQQVKVLVQSTTEFEKNIIWKLQTHAISDSCEGDVNCVLLDCDAM
jgi:hypothetical protein